MRARSWVALGLAAAMSAAMAADRDAYNRRAADTDLAAFHALDRDRNGALTPEEARGAVDFGSRFNDMDTNRDGIVTLEEMRRYIERSYGVKPAA